MSELISDHIDMQYWTDEKTGYLCIWRDTPGIFKTLCGYVAIQPDHPLYGKNSYDVEIDFYEELTYSGPIHIYGIPNSENLWLFGFDYGHGYKPKTGDIEADCEALAEILNKIKMENSTTGFQISKNGDHLFFGTRQEAVIYFSSEEYLKIKFKSEEEKEEYYKKIYWRIFDVIGYERICYGKEFILDDAIEIWQLASPIE